jgi:opacity protein-like surface antigen
MIGRITAMVALGALLTSPSWAQDQKIEVSALAGWTFSDGVSGNSIRALDGNVYNAIDPKDSFSWGFTAGYHFTPNWSLEFQYDQQQSKLQVTGTATREIGDMKIKGYHGAFVFNAGEGDAKVRPFIFLGAGATDYPGVPFTRIDGSSAEIGGQSKFSGTFGLGVKVYPGKNAGIKFQARWVPTYIKSDSAGYWCDPYWGCYVVGDPQYSNQFEFTGGITLRF